jgi:hypothetical protein
MTAAINIFLLALKPSESWPTPANIGESLAASELKVAPAEES